MLNTLKTFKDFIKSFTDSIPTYRRAIKDQK